MRCHPASLLLKGGGTAEVATLASCLTAHDALWQHPPHPSPPKSTQVNGHTLCDSGPVNAAGQCKDQPTETFSLYFGGV